MYISILKNVVKTYLHFYNFKWKGEFLLAYVFSVSQRSILSLKAVHLVNRSIKQHGVSVVRLLRGAQGDMLILGNLLPWVLPGEGAPDKSSLAGVSPQPSFCGHRLPGGGYSIRRSHPLMQE